MRLLLDTHFAVWLAIDDNNLTRAERQLIEGEDVEIVCSAVSLWELRLKWNDLTLSGTPKGPLSPETVLLFAEDAGWTLLPLLPLHAVTELEYPIAHKDPFDELLLVQAQIEKLPLLTRDNKLRNHPLALER